MVAHASVASSKLKVELNSHANRYVVGNNSLAIHDHNRSLYVYSYDQKDGLRSAKIVDATVGYQDPQSSWRFFLMIKQAIHKDGLVNHLLCLMQCHLNVVQINEVLKFLPENPNKTTHAMELVDPFAAAHSLITSLQLFELTSYFDV